MPYIRLPFPQYLYSTHTYPHNIMLRFFLITSTNAIFYSSSAECRGEPSISMHANTHICMPTPQVPHAGSGIFPKPTNQTYQLSYCPHGQRINTPSSPHHSSPPTTLCPPSIHLKTRLPQKTPGSNSHLAVDLSELLPDHLRSSNTSIDPQQLVLVPQHS